MKSFFFSSSSSLQRLPILTFWSSSQAAAMLSLLPPGYRSLSVSQFLSFPICTAVSHHWALSCFLGLFSDAFPPGGTRRPMVCSCSTFCRGLDWNDHRLTQVKLVADTWSRLPLSRAANPRQRFILLQSHKRTLGQCRSVGWSIVPYT